MTTVQEKGRGSQTINVMACGCAGRRAVKKKVSMVATPRKIGMHKKHKNKILKQRNKFNLMLRAVHAS